jgi:hypothetical protein
MGSEAATLPVAKILPILPEKQDKKGAVYA